MLQTTPQATPQFRLNVSGEFERHAAECRDMAQTAYDPACRAAFARLAEALERRAETLDETVWLKHAMAEAYSVPAAYFFSVKARRFRRFVVNVSPSRGVIPVRAGYATNPARNP